MAEKQESMEFLRASYNGKKLSGFEDLCTWYFGEKDRTVEICAHRAYRDFCRRLAGIGKSTKKGTWRKDSEERISDEIRKLLENPNMTKEAFDDWHNGVCVSLMNLAKEYDLKLKDGFTYGLAQKWLNMSIKNMIIMGKWDSQIAGIKKYLHVPVDSYIMEAASNIGVPILTKSETEREYKEGDSKPWSRWEYREYIAFQGRLREKQPIPIDWEGPAWIKIANNRKEKEKERKQKKSLPV